MIPACERLEPILDAWQTWPDPPRDRPRSAADLSSSSAVNCTVLLRSGDWRAVLKVRGDAGATFERNWDAERNLSLLAARLEFGPRVLHVDDSAGMLLLEWIEPAPRPAPAILAGALAHQLARLHGLDVELPRRDYRSEARRYREALRSRCGALSAAIEKWLDSAIAAADRLAADGLWTPTHHDLSPENLVWDGGRLLLIDWEYASCAHPAFDLACVAQLVLPDVGARARFLTRYASSGGRKISSAALEDATQLFHFYAVAWECELAARQSRRLSGEELTRLIGRRGPLC